MVKPRAPGDAVNAMRGQHDGGQNAPPPPPANPLPSPFPPPPHPPRPPPPYIANKQVAKLAPSPREITVAHKEQGNSLTASTPQTEGTSSSAVSEPQAARDVAHSSSSIHIVSDSGVPGSPGPQVSREEADWEEAEEEEGVEGLQGPFGVSVGSFICQRLVLYLTYCLSFTETNCLTDTTGAGGSTSRPFGQGQIGGV